MNRANRALRGFVVHHDRIDLDHLAPNDGTALGSSYSQADAQPGEAVPADDRSVYVPRAHQAQDADLDVTVIRPGLPQTDGASLAYRETGESDDSWRGWCEPNLVTLYRPLAWTTTEDWTVADAATIPSTQQVVAIGADQDSTSRKPVSVWTWEPTTRAWGSRVEIDSANLRTLCAILVRRRDERVLAFQCIPAAGEIVVHYSDDAGATWSEHSGTTDTNLIDAAVTRMRVVEDRYGGILLLATDASTGDWWTYRSGDGGATFEATDSGTGWGGGSSLAVLADGRILLGYREHSTKDAKCIVLEDAYDSPTGKTGTSVSASAADPSGTTDITKIEVVVDSDGIAYALFSLDGTHEVRMSRSTDNGETWTIYVDSPVGCLAATVPSNHLTRVQGIATSGGELVVLCTTDHSTAPSTDGSLLSLVLGGWSSWENPGNVSRDARDSFGSLQDATKASVFTPSETFANWGWTATGTAETLSNGYHRFNPSAATSYVDLVQNDHTSGQETLLYEVQVVSGGGTSDECVIVHSRRDGANSRTVQLRFSTTGFLLWDVNAGAQVGATVTVSMTAVLQVALSYAGDAQVTVWYKRPSSSVWTKGPQTSTLTSGLTPNNNDFHRIGCVAAGGTSDFRVGLVAWGPWLIRSGLTDDASGYSLRLAWSKALGALPYPVRDQGASTRTFVSAAGGGGRYREAFTIEADYDHGVDEVLPQESPSPASTWRSTSTAEQILCWDLGADTRIGSSWALALGLFAVNFRTAYLEVRAAADVAWTTIGTFDAGFAIGVRFALSGDLIEPDTSGSAASAFLQAQQLRNGLVILDPAGTPKARRIGSQSGGGWTLANTVKPGILLDDVDGTEPSSGVCHLIAPSGVLVVHERVDAFRYVRIRIPASQNVAESYYEIGAVVLGSVLALGRQWSRGWSWRYDPRLDVEEDDYGTLWAEQRRPIRRELTVSWQDGYDVSALRRGPEVPYLSANPSSPGLVADQDVWWQLAGLLHEAEGGALPVVPLLEVPANTTTIVDPTMHMLARLTGTVQVNNVQGDEGRSEVHRLESVTAVELV